jgi:hypothetical protein
MNDSGITKCVAAVTPSMAANERVMRIRLGQPRSSRADFLTRYKIDIATLDGSGTEASKWRCVVVNISSNTGVATIEATIPCDAVPDLVPFPSSPTTQEVAGAEAGGEREGPITTSLDRPMTTMAVGEEDPLQA